MLKDAATGYFTSANGENQIAYYIHEPQNKPIAIIQLSHGMCEYFERYDEFIRFMNDNDILVCGNDHLGHGNSVSSLEELGFFGDNNSWSDLPDDLHKMTVIMKGKHPETPYFLLGHSMGSFIARLYLTRYGYELNGAMIVGTGGKNPLSKFAITLAKTIKTFKGDHYRSKFIDKLAFEKYNDTFEEKKTKFDWLTRDTEIVNRYIDDPYCNFLFTANGFETLFTLFDKVSGKDWALQVPSDVPLLITSGQNDPVGNYGKGAQYVYDLLHQQVKDLSIKLYENGRHEIMNETNYKDVYGDMLSWVKKHI